MVETLEWRSDLAGRRSKQRQSHGRKFGSAKNRLVESPFGSPKNPPLSAPRVAGFHSQNPLIPWNLSTLQKINPSKKYNNHTHIYTYTRKNKLATLNVEKIVVVNYEVRNEIEDRAG